MFSHQDKVKWELICNFLIAIFQVDNFHQKFLQAEEKEDMTDKRSVRFGKTSTGLFVSFNGA